ncbi:MAG: hypothetical protein H0T89_36045 [Deltaproteobacteria bacterium]|nr:hypothetical protein [Deltaproteobacteria bacterium]MDQ3299452.1 hypothetical protein [Myxococcota bacterium]
MSRAILIMVVAALAACGGDDNADDLGIGAQCTMTEDCNTDEGQVCLTQFKGGYCGEQGCLHDIDCIEDSACVTHDDGNNYCFRVCTDKAQCNANRDVENEANCSSSTTFVDGAMGRKACLPPSG